VKGMHFSTKNAHLLNFYIAKLSVIHAECHYAECHHAHHRGAPTNGHHIPE
jgi:hypothetical protein